MTPFYDLNLLNTNLEAISESIFNALRLDYRTIAINNTDEEFLKETSKKIKRGTKVNPTTFDGSKYVIDKDELEKIMSKYKSKCAGFSSGINMFNNDPIKQLSRLTFILDDVSQTHKLKRTNEFKLIDLIAVQPKSEKAFNQACKDIETLDIITFDLSERLPFAIRKEAVGVAIERGIHFEINYAPMLFDSISRKNIMLNANALVKACKGKNIVLSSGSSKAIELRGPYDVANLGLLFGLSQSQAKDAVSSNCRAVFMHSITRKSHKSVISLKKIEQNADSKDEELLEEPQAKRIKL